MYSKVLVSILLLIFVVGLNAQNTKSPLIHDVYDDWRYLGKDIISNDGKWIAYEVLEQEGDAVVYLENVENGIKKTFERGRSPKFSPNSDFLTFKIRPQHDTIRQLKIDDVKKDKFPKDTLGVYVFSSDSLILFDRIKSFKLANDASSWLVFQHEKAEKQKKKEIVDDQKKNKKKKKKKKSVEELAAERLEKKLAAKNKKQKGTRLSIYNPIIDTLISFENISEYDISYNGKLIGFIENIKDSIDTAVVHLFNSEQKKSYKIFYQNGNAKKITLDRTGEYSAFMHSADTTKNKTFSLYFRDSGSEKTTVLLDTLTETIPENWTVSEFGSMYFSRNSKKLYFGTSLKPEKEQEDTIPNDEKYHLTLWHWEDPYLQPQQEKNVKQEKQRSYLAVYHIMQNRIVQLGDTIIQKVRLNQAGNGKYALGVNPLPYAYLTQWLWPAYQDYYLIDTETGEKKMIFEEYQYSVGISSAGSYLYWFNLDDQSWYAQAIEGGEAKSLTAELKVNFYNEEQDVPQKPKPYGIMGWSEDDKYFFIYDMYDIWKIDPNMEEIPVCLTGGIGRKKNIKFKYKKLDPEKMWIDLNEEVLLSGFSEITKTSGFYNLMLNEVNEPENLIAGKYRYYVPTKARDANKIIWNRMNYIEYPELFVSDRNFKGILQLTNLGKQQDKYLWGTVELVNWKTPSGKFNEGLLYKPENFDPSKKYPMIVYFYSKNSDNLHVHYTPRPSRSVINFPYYISNGYLIFVPDIHYGTGTPGQDAYNAVVSGTDFLIDMGFVDSEKVGLQGQSWGGYQIAYIVTKTDKYAAAMAGAPVSNMTSAYGGIRWGTGISRQFQYEVAQSRIGATLWERRDLYIENSPLFFADKVKTPLLIMHNDKDGAVPWYQGIEYFVALKRLRKPAWLLSYNGENHNLMKRPNCKDLSIRMSQFFDHYLKDKPAPEWMINGIPAVKKGKEDRYNLIESE